MSNPNTISQYLDEQRVDLSTASVDECSRLDIVLTQPAGWKRAPETMFPHAAAVFFDDTQVVEGFAPNVVVLIGALSRAVDAEEMLSYGFNDSRALPEWTEITRDRDQFCGLPSASVCGRYRNSEHQLVGRTRYTVVHPLVDQYLVQVTATISASQWATLGSRMEALTDSVTIGRQ